MAALERFVDEPQKLGGLAPVFLQVRDAGEMRLQQWDEEKRSDSRDVFKAKPK